jgi:hypothetical protein
MPKRDRLRAAKNANTPNNDTKSSSVKVCGGASIVEETGHNVSRPRD